MLRVSFEFERQLNEGVDRKTIFERLAKCPEKYDSKIVTALGGVLLNSDPMELREVEIGDLRVGMVLKQDLRTPGGTLLVAEGQELTFPMLKSVRNFGDRGSLKGKVRVLAPRAAV